jgi:hypothetical protein
MRKEVKPPAVRDPVETRLLKKAYHSIVITFSAAAATTTATTTTTTGAMMPLTFHATALQ